MNEQKKREAMARIEGHHVCVKCGEPMDTFPRRCPNCRYLNIPVPTYDSHDDVQRVIDGLDDDELALYVMFLNTSFKDDYVPDKRLFKATPAQKVEAILRATGGWDG